MPSEMANGKPRFYIVNRDTGQSEIPFHDSLGANERGAQKNGTENRPKVLDKFQTS